MVYRCQNVENLVILIEIAILTDFHQISKIRCVTHFRVLQHDHEIAGRGISLQKPSVHDSGRPQCDGEPWSRLGTHSTTLSNIEDFAIFPDGTVWGESTVERGFVRKVAPEGRDKTLLAHPLRNHPLRDRRGNRRFLDQVRLG